MLSGVVYQDTLLSYLGCPLILLGAWVCSGLAHSEDNTSMVRCGATTLCGFAVAINLR